MTDTSIALEFLLAFRVPAMKSIYVIWFAMLLSKTVGAKRKGLSS